MSLRIHTVIPTIKWEDLMEQRERLPEKFESTAPDDSMAPRVREGQMVTFQRGLEPRAGDGVLVADRDGHFYLRVYRMRKPGHWTAQPLNDAYEELDSAADGLEVVAVVVGVQARWA